MNTIFCPDCGRANLYSGAKPNFCNTCGAGMNVSLSSIQPEPEFQPQPRQPARQSRSQTVSSRRYRQEPEPEFENEGVSVEDLAARAKVSLVFVEKPQRPGERFDMGQVFRGGAVAAQNTGTQDDLHGNVTSYDGGDKQAYIRNHFGKNMQTTRIDAKGE